MWKQNCWSFPIVLKVALTLKNCIASKFAQEKKALPALDKAFQEFSFEQLYKYNLKKTRMKLIYVVSLRHALAGTYCLYQNWGHEFPEKNTNNVKRRMKITVTVLYSTTDASDTSTFSYLRFHSIHKWVWQTSLKDVRLLTNGSMTSLMTPKLSVTTENTSSRSMNRMVRKNF